MSFIITLHVREGIVLASDSRITLNSQQANGQGQPILNVAVGMSDSNYKTFLAYDRLGISTFGQADIKGVPISGYIETFIRRQTDGDTISPEIFANRLKDYFRTYDPIPTTGFHIAGYINDNGNFKQRIYRVDIGTNETRLLNPDDPQIGEVQGASWDGESDILSRLVQPLFIQIPKTNQFQQLPAFGIPWQFFTLQDAIDFAVYATRTTIDSIKFQPRAKTVGGPIDVLVLKPNGATWVSRKELKIS